MAELSVPLAAAFRGERPLLVGLVEINLPERDLLLIDGAGELMVGNRLFVGRDETYGVLDSIKGLADTIGDQAPTLTVGLIPASTAALAALLAANVQGSAMTVAIGCVDIATGLVVPSPYGLFAGELDVPTVTWGANNRRLEYKCTSVADRLFLTQEEYRLSDAFHQSIWPGELGLAFVTDVETTVPWGQKLDTSAVQTRTNLPWVGASTGNRT
ncbi:hypothetical protein [Sphingomonas echinoides]|uniref:Uncharacterized protein n=1 Tax=Sphingomonas echinoides TaxID=59803 RepID=A0ABU4PM09_9SPHN|nr:hypothetical protein [Sphingomonas echinoides]MDX5984700.1 hypothetical protein [Sphingomonas echinoides]